MVIRDKISDMDSQTSRTHLLLLTKFLTYDTPARYANAVYWEPVLKESAQKAIQRFLENGMLEPAGLHELLDFKFKATDLKSMLKERGFKVSSKKNDLIKRLLTGDYQGMLQATNEIQLYRCTVAGRNLAERYVKEEKEKRTKAESDVLNLLVKRNFREAVRVVATFETAQVFSRGIGIDWSTYSGERDVKALKVIFEKTPIILKSIRDDVLEKVRVGAAMLQLWGTNTIKPDLLGDSETGIHLDSDTAARMLIFYASHLRTIEQCRTAGISTIEILGTDDGSTCPACRRISGKKYNIDEIPEIPNAECTCEIGCRCTAVTGDL